MNYILLIMIIMPWIGALWMTMMKEEYNSNNNYRVIGLVISVLTLLMSILIWIGIDGNELKSIWNITIFSLELGIDGLNINFIMLTTLTMPISILASWDSITKKIKLFNILILILEGLLILVFMVQELIWFYVFFEVVLIPLFIMVGIWGASENRIRASYLLFLYTFLGSLLMLLGFLTIIKSTGTGSIEILKNSNLEIEASNQTWIWLGIFISLAIKTPIVPFHIWLSRAHVEASIGVSMILAGLILKLATYGFLKILIPILPEATSYMAPLVQTIAVITLIYSSLTTIRQSDFKVLIAYSSVAHMAIVIMGIFSNTIEGITGGILMSLAHGFVSPALFYCVGGILYDRYHTRVIRYYRGLTLTMPIFSALFLIIILGNMSTPPTINWVSETLILIGSMERSPLATFAVSTGIVFSAVYSIFLYSRLSFGQFSIYLVPLHDINRRELWVLIPLVIAMIIFGLFPTIIISYLQAPISLMIYH